MVTTIIRGTVNGDYYFTGITALLGTTDLVSTSYPINTDLTEVVPPRQKFINTPDVTNNYRGWESLIGIGHDFLYIVTSRILLDSQPVIFTPWRVPSMSQTETIINVRENLKILELTMGQLLMDDYCLKIISGTSNKSLSVSDLAFMYYIPVATCYKKVAQLEATGLIREEGKVLSKGGKTYSVYRSCLKTFNVRYADKNVIFKVELEGEPQKEISVDLENGNVVVR